MKFEKVLCNVLLGIVVGVLVVFICNAIVTGIKDPGCPCCGEKFYVVSDICKDCADDLMEANDGN